VSAGSVWIDVNSTLLIGALPKDSFLLPSKYVVHIWLRKILIYMITGSGYNYNLLPVASSMAWAENFLNFTNGYYKVASSEDDQFEYLVPFPPGFTGTTKAHWTTDVIVLDPSCSWQTGVTTGLVQVGAGHVDQSYWAVTLPESNLGFSFPNDQLGMFLFSSNIFLCLLDLSIKLWKYHMGFIFLVLQHKCCGIHSQCPCGRFCTFCHRST